MMFWKVQDVDMEVEFWEVFVVFDKDGDGFIGVIEFQSVMLQFGENLMFEDVYLMICEVD